MGSINATLLAQKVSGTLRQGKKVNLKKLAIESGYSPTTADSPSLITKSKSYQIAFALETKEIVDKIDRDIARFQEALSSKNLRKEDVKTLVASLDTLIKNKQLLSGKATENVGLNIAISEHVAGKYDKTVTEKPSDDVGSPKDGSTEPL